MTSRGPMYLTFVSVGSGMIHSTGRLQIVLGSNLFSTRPKADQN